MEQTAYVLVYHCQESRFSEVMAVTTSPLVGEEWKRQCALQESSYNEDGSPILTPGCYVEQRLTSNEMSAHTAMWVWRDQQRAAHTEAGGT